MAVLMGGPSREREISLESGKAVSQALRDKGHEVFEVREMENLGRRIREAATDCAFIALHGRFGEDGAVQKILEDELIPYTGSGPEASFLALRKDLAKEAFARAGLSTPPWRSGKFENLDQLKEGLKGVGFPLVLKPVDEGSSIGLEMVRDPGNLPAAFERIRKITEWVLVEKLILGWEMTVGILGEEPLPVVHIRTDRAFYDYEAKYSPGHTEYEVPAHLEPEVYRCLQETGRRAHEALGCRDLSRVDILLDAQGRPWVLEVNTIPGFTQRSLLPKAALAAGISFGDLCEKILQLALKRGTLGGLNDRNRVLWKF